MEIRQLVKGVGLKESVLRVHFLLREDAVNRRLENPKK